MQPTRMLLKVVATAIIAAAGYFLWQVIAYSFDSNRFERAMDRQVAIIERLNDRCPGLIEHTSLRNVWGNAVFAFFRPPYSDIESMEKLERDLDAIACETTPDNLFENVDRLYSLLADAVKDRGYADFVNRHHEGYRELVKSMQEYVNERRDRGT